MTIRVKARVTIKRFEEKPSEKPMETAREVTRAEWLEGIPPVFHSTVSAISLTEGLRRRKRMIRVLSSWAKNQLLRAERKTGLSSRTRRFPAFITRFLGIGLESRTGLALSIPGGPALILSPCIKGWHMDIVLAWSSYWDPTMTDAGQTG